MPSASSFTRAETVDFCDKGKLPLLAKCSAIAALQVGFPAFVWAMIKADGIQKNGISYEFKVIEDRKHTPHDRCAVEHFCLVRANVAPVQIELFQ